MKKLFTLCMFFGLLLSARVVQATTYYVAASGGDDARSCATAQVLGTPKATITSGLTCLASGDTLFIRTGTYPERFTQTQIPSGTAGAYTTISAYNNEAVVIKPTGTATILNLEYQTTPVRYIIFDGLTWDGTAKATINFLINLDGVNFNTNVDHLRFIRNEMRQAKMSCTLAGRGANFLEFIDSKFHDCGTSVDYDHGIYLQSSDSLVEGCESYNNMSSGIQIYTGLLSGADRTNRNIVRRNYVHNNRFGIILGTGDSNQGIRNIVANNTAYAGSYGIVAYNGCTNCKLYNNTVYGNTLEGIQIRPGSSNTTMRNNISYNNPGGNIHDYVVTGTIASNNLTTNPTFVDAAGGDFGLTATSTAAIDQGYASAIPGITCNGVCDIGAFETITFAGATLVDDASDNKLNVTLLNNNAPPALPAATCATFTAKKNTTNNLGTAVNNVVTNCTRIANNIFQLTLTNSYTGTDYAWVSYAVSNVTDSALIGNLKNQRLNAFTDQTVANPISGSVPTLTQVSYQFRCFGGTEAVPDCTKAINSQIIMPPNTSVGVRFLISNTVASFGASGYTVYARRNETGSYDPIPNGPCTSTGICWVTGTGTMPPEMTAADDTTEKLAGAGTFVSAEGVLFSANEVPNITLSTGQDTEILAMLAVGSGNSSGDRFDLRVYRAGGIALTSYTQTARILIGGYTSQFGNR